MVDRSIPLFLAAALAEIGGAYLIWIGLREGAGLAPVLIGIAALGLDDFRPDRYDLTGIAACLAGVGTIMYAPR